MVAIRSRVGTRRVEVAALIALSLLSAIATSEMLLRLLRYQSILLQRLLYLPGEDPHYEKIDSTAALLAVAPFHPPPFLPWGGFKLNHLGLRTGEYSRDKAPGTYRILALGDSFTFDSAFVPPEQVWHALIGRDIEERTGERVEVINLGVPAVGPQFSLRIFELEGRELSPNLVLFGLFMGNDLTDEAGHRGSIAIRWSFTWRMVKHLVELWRHHELLRNRPPADGPGGFPVKDSPYNPDATIFGEEAFLRSERESLVVFRSSMRGEVETWIERVVRTLATLDQEVRSAGGELVVLIIPDQLEVNESVRRVVLESGSFKPADYDFDWPQRTIAKRLAAAHVSAIDPLLEFRAAPATPRLYRYNDSHWSAAGNAIAARVVADHLAAATR